MKLFPSIIILLFVLSISSGFSQTHSADSSKVGLNKNITYLTLGYGGLYGVIDVNYERIFSQKEKGFFKYYLARFCVGASTEGPLLVTGLTGLTGKGKNHFEVHLGVTALYDKEGYKSDVSYYKYSNGQYHDSEPSKMEHTNLFPAIAIGYRFQKPGGRFVFRIGGGIPDAAYVSFGVCF